MKTKYFLTITVLNIVKEGEKGYSDPIKKWDALSTKYLRACKIPPPHDNLTHKIF